MSLFSSKNSTERVGAIIDIGSGSVLVAVVVSQAGEKSPTIVWSHREQAPLRTIDSLEQSAKSVMTSLINALLKFDSEGRRALHDFNKRSHVDEIQCSISAPWAYTVSKKVTYTQDEPFEITKTLIDSLVESAEKSTQSELAETEAATKLGLGVITRSTLDSLANGYRVTKLLGNHATELTMTHVSVLTQQYLIEHLQDLRHKMFAQKPLHQLSYMLALYSVTDELFHDSSDYCLVDVTYEATEIGIVRDGILTYTTHIPFGSFSLAREISEATSLPLLQSFQSLHTTDIETFLATLTAGQKSSVEKIFEAYVARLSSLFNETGDELSIPKKMYLHGDVELEAFFSTQLTQAAQSIVKGSVRITPLSTLLVDMVRREHTETNTDTAMLVAAKFFHTQNNRRKLVFS